MAPVSSFLILFYMLVFYNTYIISSILTVVKVSRAYFVMLYTSNLIKQHFLLRSANKIHFLCSTAFFKYFLKVRRVKQYFSQNNRPQNELRALTFYLWHFPCIAQFSQPQPHEDLPCFLSFIILTTISETTAISIRDTTIVPIFSVNHASILPLL